MLFFVSSPTLAHFHGPANRTENGGPEIVMAGNATAAASPIIGSAIMTAQQEIDFTSGNMYINIHSVTFGNGEIRGQQFFGNVRFAAPIDPKQDGVNSTNLGTGIVSVASDSSSISVALVSTIASPAAVHIHCPAGLGMTANPCVYLAIAQSSFNYILPIAASIEANLAAGQAYFNVHTSAFPNGEIRGQIGPFNQLIPGQTTGSPAASSKSTSGASTVVPMLLSVFLAALLVF